MTRQPWVPGQHSVGREREEFLGLGEVTDHRRSHLASGNVFLNQISQDTLDIDL